MKRYCLALDLKNDLALIDHYIAHHKSVWPEVLASIENSEILQMEIFHIGDRLFLIVETTDTFSFEDKAARDQVSDKVQEWEQLMDKYQATLPFAKPNEKWVLMNKIFDFKQSKG